MFRKNITVVNYLQLTGVASSASRVQLS